jgi:hypothetical protein
MPHVASELGFVRALASLLCAGAFLVVVAGAKCAPATNDFDPQDDRAGQGTEGRACFQGACNDGLVCVDDVCVRDQIVDSGEGEGEGEGEGDAGEGEGEGDAGEGEGEGDAGEGEGDEGEGEGDSGAGEGEGEGDSGEGEGEEGEGEGAGGLPLHAPCDLFVDECGAELVCLPEGVTGPARCARRCDALDDEGRLVKDPGVTCPDDTSCLTLLVTPIDLSAMRGFIACDAPAPEGGACAALGEDGACVVGDCIQTSVTFDDNGGIAELPTLGCRRSCALAGNDSDCGQEQVCLNRRIAVFENDLTIQTEAGVEVSCTSLACDGGVGVCPCDPGFFCANLGNAGAPDFKCLQVTGICGEPVPLFTLGASAQAPFSAFRCNEIDETALCDTRIFEGLADPPDVRCLSTGNPANENDGVCVALCHFPTTAPGQRPFDASCGDGLQCNNAVGLALGLNGECSPAACPPGALCSTCNAQNPGVTEGRCAPLFCNSSADCPAGSGCNVQGQCTRAGSPIGQCQIFVSSCETPVECVYDIDCPEEGSVCFSGECFAPNRCGDGVLDADEECDGDLGVACNDAGEAGAACTSECQLDQSLCAPLCGNGLLDGDEECDGDIGAVCGEPGEVGALCTQECRLDDSGCALRCGNGVLDDGEDCDGDVGVVCAAVDELGAVCTEGCTLDLLLCHLPDCGDGVREGEEACDGDDGTSCPLTGQRGARCTERCVLDLAGCAASCGNGVVDAEEECDDAAGAACLVEGEVGAVCSGCQLDVTDCHLPLCGDLQREGGEECDGEDGTRCPANDEVGAVCVGCVLDTERCSRCGNGVLDDGEECDGTLGVACESADETGAVCNGDCTLSTTGCRLAAVCGNGVVELDEECDGTNFGTKSCFDYRATNGATFTGGALTCSADCQEVDVSSCVCEGFQCPAL